MVGGAGNAPVRHFRFCFLTPDLQSGNRITSLGNLIDLPSIALSRTNERPPSHEAMEGILHSGPTARRHRAKDGSGGGSCTHGGKAYEAHLNLILPAMKFTILDLHVVPEMMFCEDVAGTAFEVLFEMLSLFNRLERDIDLDLPRPKLGSMGTLPGVMIRESLTEVCGMTNVTPARTAQALDYVRVKHAVARHP